MKRSLFNLMGVIVVVSLVLTSVALAGPARSTPDLSQTAGAKRTSAAAPMTDPEPPAQPAPQKVKPEEQEIEGDPLDRDYSFYSRRTAGDPNVGFTLAQAAELRAQAAGAVAVMNANAPSAPTVPGAFGGAWASAGPNPMVLTSRGDATFDAMAGRIGALAIRSSAPYTIYLGGAQGGMWVSSTLTGGWTAKTDQLPSLAIGAIALAPSNEDVVYVGTGEGALSGDSYFGDGVLKSMDAGNTFSKVSATGYFTSVSISKIVVDNTDPNTLYVGTLRGRGGARRTSPSDASPFGVWKSTDGGVSWSMVLTVTTNPLLLAGVTDLAIDPQNSQVIYATLLSRGISKTVDGGATWFTAMNGLPNGNYAAAPSRFALGISRPSAAVSATLYTGFEYYSGTTKISSKVWKSTDDGLNWSQTNTAVVNNYCGTQCTYDNVIGVDPISPTVVYALGLYNYGTGSGGIYRSMDGGANWVDIGFNLHPDYHAFAVRRDAPENIVMGNDGGVWSSSQRGGRLNSGDPLSATVWSNLNGLVNPTTSDVITRYGLQLGQYTSIATNPAVANRFYGGTQDNGTLRKSTTSATWVDTASGDGGQVLVDPTDANYVYGTYYGVSPYRFTDGAVLYGGGFTSNEYIDGGINTNDRSEFYIPWMMDPANPSRLYLGTYRVYRTDNAKAVKSADVLWNAISGDLTSGCTGSAPNGARGCVIGTFGKSAGSPALYVGTLEGWIWLSKDSTVASPVWTRVDVTGTTPMRPVAAIAVDASNYRVAYAGFNGFNAATPTTPGHVFKTTNGGQTWTNITGNLPDIPVNSLVIDPANPQTLYAGTDVGPFVTTDGGATWSALGTGFPIVAIWQLALNPYTRQVVAGTHGRGAFSLTDSATQMPALQISKMASDTPIGPGSSLVYYVTVQNMGNVTATNIVITDPLPANTTFVSAGSGGALNGSQIVWTMPNVPPPTVVSTGGSLGVGVQPGSLTVSFTVQITNSLTSGSVITNDGMLVTSAEGVGASGSPYYVTLAPANSVQLTPASINDGARPGQSITHTFNVRNMGYNTDSYNLSVAGNSFQTTFWNASFTTQITNTGNVAPGATAHFGVKVTVPVTATNNQADAATVTVTSTGNPSVKGTATVHTIAVTYQVLLVDNDGSGPNVESYYTAALARAYPFYNYWDLNADPVLPLNYMKAHKVIVWFTGASYPGPLLPYETNLAAFLDNGGQLFLSGWDILDQAAGTTAFVHDYLHVNWDGTEAQNDKGTGSVTAVPTNTVTAGMGTLAVNYVAVGLGSADYSDQLTLVAPATPAFRDTGTALDNALTVADVSSVTSTAYRIVFLAFPYEALGTADNRADLMQRVFTYFGLSAYRTYLPIVMK